jgi:hypothetical protein
LVLHVADDGAGFWSLNVTMKTGSGNYRVTEEGAQLKSAFNPAMAVMVC